MSVSTAQIAAQLETVLASVADASAVAIRSPTRQPWPDVLTQGGKQFALRWCESLLAIRQALWELEEGTSGKAALVILTPLATHEIAEDIASRLTRARVFQPEGWDTVRQLFQAKEMDARLGRFAWLPQLLIDGSTSSPYPPVASGFLDLDTAWREVLRRFLGIASSRPDAVELLKWTLVPEADPSLKRIPAATRADVMSWLSASSGLAGKMILACVEAGQAADALALGLVCDVIFAPGGEGQTELAQAAIRLERFTNGVRVGPAEGQAWAKAARETVVTLDADRMRPVLERADSLLESLMIAPFAYLSDLLPIGLEQGLDYFGVSLSAHLRTPSTVTLADVEEVAERVLKHHFRPAQEARFERVEMAVRLARWLATEMPRPASLSEAFAWAADEGAFVDWARFRLLGGDDLRDLSTAYALLCEAVSGRRKELAQKFAQALRQEQIPEQNCRVIPVERVLERVVGPLAASHRVLLIVIDGLSLGIYHELFARLGSYGWTELVPAENHQRLMAAAALPTVTEVCRASLLSGRLTSGAAPQEKSAFSTHPVLVANSRSALAPCLFHKGELAEETNLSVQVRTAIANDRQQVVGVVYNAIDDHLSGSDQLRQRWALDELRLLLPMLREARDAKRVVVITADHGHVLEDGTVQLAGEDHDRWRPGFDPRAPHEIAFQGERVMAQDGTGTVICLWGERTRYGSRKNGYHGGASPQEVAVPLAVLAPIGMSVAGWDPAPPVQPDWWEFATQRVLPTPSLSAPITRPAPPRESRPDVQPELFDLPEDLVRSHPDDWIGALLASPIYASQRQLAARVAISDERMRLLLGALVERGGKLSRAALAQRLALPEIRVTGLLSAARRMLNVDQEQVLVVNESAGIVELHQELLLQQFRLNTWRRS